MGDGVDLLVDALGYAPSQAEHLTRLSRRCGGTAYLSAKAVYVDPRGHHLNSPGGAHVTAPVPESTPTMAWAGHEVRSREGYGAGKAESERVLRDHGERVSVLRPSTIHGAWVRRGRTAAVLALARRVRRGEGPTVAVLPRPGRRRGRVDHLHRGPRGCRARPRRPPPDLPWRVPMMLDTTRLTHLGVTLPTSTDALEQEVRWLLHQRGDSPGAASSPGQAS
ncbi:hypothetical protein BJF80_10470 [Serinicoccus sp. CUA-874]|uniref:hypothetical protein n=1 Tax=Serinicoccus sp. CUA-874 TaxID=1517939 RepID=UPI000968D455|nr:hypothetical protein [Serinicoccus sp. CUA-874]OLT15284.1 hypothetical protein BJF80_10470 [Serinicoccus sp. CUA-874]